jgi:hypothetical protein
MEPNIESGDLKNSVQFLFFPNLTIEKPKKTLKIFPFWGEKSQSSKTSPEEKTLAPEGSSICILLELVLGPKNEVTTNKL